MTPLIRQTVGTVTDTLKLHTVTFTFVMSAGCLNFFVTGSTPNTSGTFIGRQILTWLPQLDAVIPQMIVYRANFVYAIIFKSIFWWTLCIVINPEILWFRLY